ncbi:hypothetical protein [Pseudomonas sp. H9]|uniref:hypothetical protein n=1 Tax=Pseudomonas sp. H9 TaxID=483968 RepID=UPI0010576B17|nr:hypothetical protein [Pseudomonas sp. H9]TDF77714.1 hypothetical protein E1573_26560 [Pseudomonas sp. H9]
MKSKLLVHPSQARTIDNPVEIERLLSQGWLLAKPKPRTATAKSMRALRTKRRADGWVNLTLWFAAQDLAAVRAARLPGETYAGLLVRLLREQGCYEERTLVDAHD